MIPVFLSWCGADARYGELIDPRRSPYVWLGDFHHYKTEDIAPHNMASDLDDEQDVSVLNPLIKAIQVAYVNNFVSAVLVVGAQIPNIHYEVVFQLEGGVYPLLYPMEILVVEKAR